MAGAAAYRKISATATVTGAADDFKWYYLGARAVLAGLRPYERVRVGGFFRLIAPFLYPLPAALVVVPFAGALNAIPAASVFVGLSTILLAWGITRDGFSLLPIFGSAPFIWSVYAGQFAPLLAAAALIPRIGWVAIVKPNLGLAVFAYRSTRGMILGATISY